MRHVGRAGDPAGADNDAISQTIDLAPAVRNGEARRFERTIAVTPETEFAIVARRDAGANAYID